MCGDCCISIHYTELRVEATEERGHVDGGGQHQRNQLVPLTEGELCQEKTRRSKSSCYNQVRDNTDDIESDDTEEF